MSIMLATAFFFATCVARSRFLRFKSCDLESEAATGCSILLNDYAVVTLKRKIFIWENCIFIHFSYYLFTGLRQFRLRCQRYCTRK